MQGPLKAALQARHGADWAGVIAMPPMCGDAVVEQAASVQPERLAEWAAAIVERCAVLGPCGGPHQALLPLICALPKVPALV